MYMPGHRPFGTIAIMIKYELRDFAMLPCGLSNNTRVPVPRPVVGHQLSRVGFDHLNQKRIAGAFRDAGVKSQVQLIIPSRVAIAFLCGVPLTGQHGIFQLTCPCGRKPSCGKASRLPLKSCMNLKDGEEFFEGGFEQDRAFAGKPPDEANRLQLDEGFPHGGARNAMPLYQLAFLQLGARHQSTGFDICEDGIQNLIRLSCHHRPQLTAAPI